MPHAPIALFCYNRLDHLRQTIQALQNNEGAAESDLLIFSDGPKNEADATRVKLVRSYLSSVKGFKTTSIEAKTENQGLAQSIINGVSQAIQCYKKVIVIEDDLVSSSYFLKFMNEALNAYENEDRVISIHGNWYATETKLPSSFFLRGADCWGWATWKRGWNFFNPNGTELLKQIQDKNLEKEFDINGTFPYVQMLKDQIDGKNQSWAIRWFASTFLSQKLSLYPNESFIRNIGFDGSGTHGGPSSKFEVPLANKPIPVGNILVEENQVALKDLERFYRRSAFIPRTTFFDRLVKRLRHCVRGPEKSTRTACLNKSKRYCP